MSLSCTLWTCTGVIHSAIGLSIPELRTPLIRVFTEMDTVGNGTTADRYEREAAVWFQVAGILMALQGMAWKQYIQDTHREELPKWWGWSITIVGGIGVSIMPASGFWLVLAQGLRILYKTRTTIGKKNQ